jgi:GDP/UDP-N,N'-diacetylbacillosamine 2-epimerase (hydrolysing)
LNNKKRKVCVTTGTRSEYGLLKPVIEKITSSKNLELHLIVSGMHLSKKFGMTINEIKNDGFKVNSIVHMIPKRDTNYGMSQSLGNGILEFSKIFNKLKPDINLILGDRDEAFASALAASHMNIVNAHIHGGDKSKAGIDEYNRHAITKISNLHFAASKKSKERIIRMGENPKYVYFTGSPGIDDVLKNYITDKNSLEKKYQIKFRGDEIILLQHPVTTQSENTNKEILSTLRAIVKLKKPTIAIAPNSDAGNKTIFKNIESFSKKYSFIKMYRSFPRNDFLGLLQNCGILVGNSSSGIIEASYFKIPVLNIGIRQDQREHGKNVINVNFDSNEIYQSMIKSFKSTKNNTKPPMIYGTGNTSKKIISILEKIKIDKELIQKQIFY